MPSPAELPSAWKRAWPWVFWLAWGLWLAVSDLHGLGAQPAIVMLLAGAAVLGFARPGTWWFWSLAIAAWIPAEPIVNDVLRLGLEPHVHAADWVLPPIPALVGGILGRNFAKGVRERDRH